MTLEKFRNNDNLNSNPHAPEPTKGVWKLNGLPTGFTRNPRDLVIQARIAEEAAKKVMQGFLGKPISPERPSPKPTKLDPLLATPEGRKVTEDVYNIYSETARSILNHFNRSEKPSDIKQLHDKKTGDKPKGAEEPKDPTDKGVLPLSSVRRLFCTDGLKAEDQINPRKSHPIGQRLLLLLHLLLHLLHILAMHLLVLLVK